jgi:hypothetical protein
MEDARTYTAFAGSHRLAAGPVRDMLREAKAYLDAGGSELLLIFDDQTGAQVEFDFRGSPDEVVARLDDDPAFAAPPPARPGRPKLGVVSREISLLPRHWEWLDRQPSGCSAALRRLVEAASKTGQTAQRARSARDAAGKFMWAMAGNLPNFEEASRALYAGDQVRLVELVAGWPHDIRDHVMRLAGDAALLDASSGESPGGAGAP